MISSYTVVLKNKYFCLLWLGQITSQIALNMLSFVLAIRVYQLTSSNAAVSLMYLSFGIPAIFFGVVAGGIVDYFDKRLVLVLCNVFRVFLLFAFYFIGKTLLTLYILSMIISIVTQFFIPAEGPSIPSLVKKTQLLAANSLFTISFYLSTVIGFITAGPILKVFGPTDAYLTMVGLMAIASFFVLRLPKIRPKKNGGFKLTFASIGKIIDQGLRFIKSNKRVRESLILMTFSQALISTLAVLAPGFADKVLSIELVDISFLVMGPAALGLMLGAFWVGGVGTRFLKGTVILTGIVATGVILIFLSVIAELQISFNNNMLLSFSLLALLGFFNSFIAVPASTIIQEDSKEEMIGRVYGVLTSLTGGVSFLPVVFSGILADVIGVGRALSVIGVCVMLIGGYQYFDRKKHKIRIKN